MNRHSSTVASQSCKRMVMWLASTKNATYDKKSNFEIVVAESKIDGNYYLCPNMTEPSFTSTVFTVTRSTKHLERGYLTRCQAFNGMKRIVKFLEQKLMENWVDWRYMMHSKPGCSATLAPRLFQQSWKKSEFPPTTNLNILEYIW